MQSSSSLSLVVALVALFALRKVMQWWFRESSLKNLPGPGGYSWLTGHTSRLFDRQGWQFHLKDIVSYGSAVRLRGYLGEDILYVTDPVALRTILVKEHGHVFDEPPMIIERNKLLWGPGLLSSTGSAHKRQRTIAGAAFSERRMKSLMPVFYGVVKRLEATLSHQLRFGPLEVDLMLWMSRCSLELVGQAGVGVSFDNLQEESAPNDYMLAAKQLIPLSFPLQAFMRAIPYIVRLGPPKFLGILASIAPHPNIRRLREIAYFLYSTNAELYHRRKREILNGGSRAVRMDDTLSSLIRDNESTTLDSKLADDEIISQIGTLIFAGQDTTSVALARMLDVLAYDQPRQNRLRAELRDAAQLGEQGHLSYDHISKLPYLDAVCKETLRLYSPVTQLHRVPRQDAVVPLGRPVLGNDGKFIHQLSIETGTLVVVGAAAVNRDPLIWGETAEQWIPERWLNPLPKSVTDAYLPSVYSHMMTFMGGGRSCIGFKFAEIEIKVVLHILVSRFRFEPGEASVCWNMFNFATPTVNDKPSLPLRVTLLA